jgi:hypothetical protein
MIVFLLIVPLLVSLIFAPAPEVRVVTDPECSGSFGLVEPFVQAVVQELTVPIRDGIFVVLADI